MCSSDLCFQENIGKDGYPCPVGKWKPNDLGLFDMVGNLREWAQDNEKYATAKHPAYRLLGGNFTDNAFLFKYSQRKDTPAAAMPDQIPEELIEQRHARLLETINAIGKRKYDAFVGRLVRILVEGPSKKNSARMTGRTPCNKIVLFDGSERHRGQLMDVKITRTGSFTLYGDPAIVGL